MQDKSTIRKWSELQGMAAVSIESGKKVGTVEDFYFDPNTNNIPALVIRTGLLSKQVLPTRSITAIGIDATTFANENVLIKDNEDKQLVSLLLGRSLLSYHVLSESGTVIGTIGNILLDTSPPTEPRIKYFELGGGLRSYISRKYPSFEAAQVIRHGRDVVVVPNAVAEDLQRR